MTSPFAKTRLGLVCLFIVLAANLLMAQSLRNGEDKAPDGKHGQSGQTLPATGPIGQTVVQGNGINYHGGPVLKASPVPIYIIWYGNWNGGTRPSDSQATVSLIEGFLGSNSLGGSSYEAINTTYGDATGNVSDLLRLPHPRDHWRSGYQVRFRRKRGSMPEWLRNSNHRPQQPLGWRRRRGRHEQRDHARNRRSYHRPGPECLV